VVVDNNCVPVVVIVLRDRDKRAEEFNGQQLAPAKTAAEFSGRRLGRDKMAAAFNVHQLGRVKTEVEFNVPRGRAKMVVGFSVQLALARTAAVNNGVPATAIGPTIAPTEFPIAINGTIGGRITG
jgi:hypothetical protein